MYICRCRSAKGGSAWSLKLSLEIPGFRWIYKKLIRITRSNLNISLATQTSSWKNKVTKYVHDFQYEGGAGSSWTTDLMGLHSLWRLHEVNVTKLKLLDSLWHENPVASKPADWIAFCKKMSSIENFASKWPLHLGQIRWVNENLLPIWTFSPIMKS